MRRTVLRDTLPPWGLTLLAVMCDLCIVVALYPSHDASAPLVALTVLVSALLCIELLVLSQQEESVTPTVFFAWSGLGHLLVQGFARLAALDARLKAQQNVYMVFLVITSFAAGAIGLISTGPSSSAAETTNDVEAGGGENAPASSNEASTSGTIFDIFNRGSAGGGEGSQASPSSSSTPPASKRFFSRAHEAFDTKPPPPQYESVPSDER
ncbi:hypothetical protein JCM8547_000705 [Rhodosporidiobolus lusitaniae]